MARRPDSECNLTPESNLNRMHAQRAQVDPQGIGAHGQSATARQCQPPSWLQPAVQQAGCQALGFKMKAAAINLTRS